MYLWFYYWLWFYFGFWYIRHSQVFDEKEWNGIKMFHFTKLIFASAMMLFDSVSSVNPLEFVLMSNQECKVRPENVNFNSNEQCSGSCNNIRYWRIFRLFKL